MPGAVGRQAQMPANIVSKATLSGERGGVQGRCHSKWASASPPARADRAEVADLALLTMRPHQPNAPGAKAYVGLRLLVGHPPPAAKTAATAAPGCPRWSPPAARSDCSPARGGWSARPASSAPVP